MTNKEKLEQIREILSSASFKCTCETMYDCDNCATVHDCATFDHICIKKILEQ